MRLLGRCGSALFGKLAPQGVSTPVGLYIGADSKNSKMNTVYASQSGLNLPDRDYYLQDNEKFEDIQEILEKSYSKLKFWKYSC